MTAAMLSETNKPLIFLLSIIATITTTQAQIFGIGSCPDVQTVSNFNAAAYMGKWYEYSKYPIIFQLFGKCTMAIYTPQPDGSIGVFNSQTSLILNNQQSINGTAEVVGDGKLYVRFDNIPDFGYGNYWVLGTDYTSYSVVFSCSDFLHLAHRVQIWILTRERHPDNAAIAAAMGVLTAQDISLLPLQETDQSNCNN